VVTKRHQGGEEFEYDRGVDEVDFFPYGLGDPIGARGRGGGGFGVDEFHLFLCEGGSRGVSL